ncbi:MAG: UDP-N-acetylmuramoyl-tripeptide--D-alanyl-D-alanine ligase [Alphaproteobacteria bacterium]|nr:UDP-N-acetylmuramoyl-tripeptide--D-alanyl-D-alanine ligase [Alphaproteobacteria bacterium]
MNRPLWTKEELAQVFAMDAANLAAATGISIDTRTLKAGDLFIAIRGDKMDGHDFAAKAQELGASALLVDHPLPGIAIPQIVVTDTLEGLRRLAAAACERNPAQRIAVTGSVGKTGTKDMLSLILSGLAPTHATQGNLNNHYGLPLTLARLPALSAYAVLEMGMNHAGELAPLSQLARPHIAIITTVEPVHIEFFPTLSDVAEAKAEIFAGLMPKGVAILNRDNAFFGLLSKRAREKGARVVSFGRHIESDFRLLYSEIVGTSTEVLALAGERPLAYRVGIAGHHWGLNSLAALAGAASAGVDVGAAATALSAMTPPKGRGARRLAVSPDGGTFELIDESYNASPASMQAAIITLAQIGLSGKGRRIAVLGDMLELGAQAPVLHRGLRDVLEQARIDRVFTAGPLMEQLFESLPQAMRGGHAASSAELAPLVAAQVRENDVVMVKGSAGSRMGRVVDALSAVPEAQSCAANGQ